MTALLRDAAGRRAAVRPFPCDESSRVEQGFKISVRRPLRWLVPGPAPAASLAASKGWQPLGTPGILVGVFGYAIAAFIGVTVAALLAW